MLELLHRDARPRPLRRPAGFGFAVEGGIQPGKGIGASPRRWRVPTTATKYVAKGGSGTGTTSGDPIGTVWQVLNAVNQPTTIYVLQGDGSDLDLSNGIAGVNCVDDVEIIVVTSFATLAPGRRRITMAAPLTWTSVGSGVYSAPMAGAYAFAPYNVVDEATLDAYGGGAWLVPRADQAAVAANPGSWAKVGSDIFVRTSDSRAPDSRLLVFKNANLASTVFANTDLYLEGVELLGGAQPLYMPQSGTATLVRCHAKYGRLAGFTFNGATRANLFECRATGNGGDGITYTSTLRALEVGCTSCKNGDPITPTNINNGSTMHSAGSIIRVDGVYRDNQGPNVADVGGGSSWLVRCQASGSTATQSTQRVGLHVQGTAWLDACDFTGNPEADLKPELNGDVINVYGTRYATIAGAGAVRASRG